MVSKLNFLEFPVAVPLNVDIVPGNVIVKLVPDNVQDPVPLPSDCPSASLTVYSCVPLSLNVVVPDLRTPSLRSPANFQSPKMVISSRSSASLPPPPPLLPLLAAATPPTTAAAPTPAHTIVDVAQPAGAAVMLPPDVAPVAELAAKTLFVDELAAE